MLDYLSRIAHSMKEVIISVFGYQTSYDTIKRIKHEEEEKVKEIESQKQNKTKNLISKLDLKKLEDLAQTLEDYFHHKGWHQTQLTHSGETKHYYDFVVSIENEKGDLSIHYNNGLDAGQLFRSTLDSIEEVDGELIARYNFTLPNPNEGFYGTLVELINKYHGCYLDKKSSQEGQFVLCSNAEFRKRTAQERFSRPDRFSTLVIKEEYKKDKSGKVKPSTVKSGITFASVGGLEPIINELQYIVEVIKDQEKARAEGCEQVSGVLMYGPTGTGKTLLAKALSNEADAKFLAINLGNILTKWYGVSEENLSNIFKEAENSKGTTILFFDEIDGICINRTTDTHLTDRRLVNIFLDYLDGINKVNNVIVVGTTNSYDPENEKFAIDEALLRPGRFDYKLRIPLPDERGRKEIFDIHINRIKKQIQKNIFEENINLQKLVEESKDASGADIKGAIDAAVRRRYMSLRFSGEDIIITTSDLIEALNTILIHEKKRRPIGFK